MELTGANFFVIKMQIGLSCTCLSKHGFLSVLPHGKHLCLEARHHWHAIQGPSGRPPGSNKYNYINISNHHFLYFTVIAMWKIWSPILSFLSNSFSIRALGHWVFLLHQYLSFQTWFSTSYFIPWVKVTCEIKSSYQSFSFINAVW